MCWDRPPESCVLSPPVCFSSMFSMTPAMVTAKAAVKLALRIVSSSVILAPLILNFQICITFHGLVGSTTCLILVL